MARNRTRNNTIPVKPIIPTRDRPYQPTPYPKPNPRKDKPKKDTPKPFTPSQKPGRHASGKSFSLFKKSRKKSFW